MSYAVCVRRMPCRRMTYYGWIP